MRHELDNRCSPSCFSPARRQLTVSQSTCSESLEAPLQISASNVRRPKCQTRMFVLCVTCIAQPLQSPSTSSPPDSNLNKARTGSPLSPEQFSELNFCRPECRTRTFSLCATCPSNRRGPHPPQARQTPIQSARSPF